MIDFHTIRSETKRQLLVLEQQLDINSDPLAWAWMTRAFASDGRTNNPPLAQAIDQARRWLATDANWQQDAQLGAIGLLSNSLDRPIASLNGEWLNALAERVAHLRKQVPGKFARLNDPDWTYGLAQLGRGTFPEELEDWLREHCIRCAQSENIRRAVLFSAAADALGGSSKPLIFNVAALAIHEIIPVLWLTELRAQLIEGDERRLGVWEAYERLKDGIALSEPEGAEGALYIANPTDLAMLYEAVSHKTIEADFVALFNNIPWHSAVRNTANSLFLKGEYISAVFEAAKLFVDEVKKRAGNPVDVNGKPLDGVPLMTHVFAPKSPRLKFTSLANQTEQNEHRGLALIAEGIVSALRNPKGHVPGAAIALNPEEALEQLAMISYLMRRLDSTT